MFSYGAQSLATGAYLDSVKDRLFTGEDLRYQKISARDVGSRAYLKNRNHPATFGALAEKMLRVQMKMSMNWFKPHFLMQIHTSAIYLVQIQTVE
ncbi:MAG: hypothetical protein LBP35_02840 [Candidatus Ancillula trichonymphae]|jgi:hypothetical protein|nr:hypothetical protein [Candidatus Ancillula trichonymphae]